MKPKGLTLHYVGFQILHGNDFTAKVGNVTCIMGTNRVGKTRFLMALAGTHIRSGGDVILNGRALGRQRPQDMATRGVSVVPQGRTIFPLLTMQDDLETAYAVLPAAQHRVPDELHDLFPS